MRARDCLNCGYPLEHDFVRCPECGESAVQASPPPRPSSSDGGTSVIAERPTNLGHLIIAAGPDAGRSFQLGSVTDIGRSQAENQIVLDERAVSRQHGRILVQDGRFIYFDLGSRNGTWLVTAQGTRRRVKGSAPLQDGDQLEIGAARLVFHEVGK